MDLGAQKKDRGFEHKKKNWIWIKKPKDSYQDQKKNLGPKLKNTDPEQTYKIDPGAKKIWRIRSHKTEGKGRSMADSICLDK